MSGDRPERATESGLSEFTLSVIVSRRVNEPTYSAALTGRFQCLPNPGLKPRATFFNRFAVFALIRVHSRLNPGFVD
jgi:hypothetical protein